MFLAWIIYGVGKIFILIIVYSHGDATHELHIWDFFLLSTDPNL